MSNRSLFAESSGYTIAATAEFERQRGVYALNIRCGLTAESAPQHDPFRILAQHAFVLNYGVEL